MTTTTNATLLAAFGLPSTLVLKGGDVLESLSVVRHVPKRRCVCRAVWQGQRVYVKLFFGEKAKLYAQRDVNGIQHFQKANILTPQIVLQDAFEPDGFAVVFEEISQASNAEALLLASDQKQLAVCKRLMQTVAAHHEAGLVQTDLYLKNFLVSNEKLYSIDGDGVHYYGAMTQRAAVANLSQLLSKFDVLMLEKNLPSLLEAYGRARSWVVFPSVDDVKAKVNQARYKATTAYADKKVFRTCTDVLAQKGHHYFSANTRGDELKHLPSTVEGYNRLLETGDTLKQGNTCTVGRQQLGGLDVVIKRYNIKNGLHQLSRAFRQTRASVSWANAHRLTLLGIATPAPIALYEQRFLGFLRGRAFFLTHYVDQPDINLFFEVTKDKQKRSAAVRQTVELFYRLHLMKLSHGDMKQTNIKVLNNGKPLLIDLDSMRQHRYATLAQKAHVRDLKRFMRNWKDQPSLYNAFVKVFKVVYADHAPLQAAQILK